ncbi:hypothetical protein [Marinococcus halophilus]|uniref:hypothetical protein n=1 Tax=Marinococcus halophilus TaxID=1371 RepID=UPI0015C4496D|nr:hypothetical protein [Marinococcus halophilus]
MPNDLVLLLPDHGPVRYHLEGALKAGNQYLSLNTAKDRLLRFDARRGGVAGKTP